MRAGRRRRIAHSLKPLPQYGYMPVPEAGVYTVAETLEEQQGLTAPQPSGMTFLQARIAPKLGAIMSADRRLHAGFNSTQHVLERWGLRARIEAARDEDVRFWVVH